MVTWEARFWAKIEKTDTCWLWSAGKESNGYGIMRIDNRNRSVHRLSYELLVGEIPEGLVIDHLCRVRHCVNPDHLEAVTRQENTKRGLPGQPHMFCNQGHPFTEENSAPQKNGKFCRICRRAAERRRYWATKAATQDT